MIHNQWNDALNKPSFTRPGKEGKKNPTEKIRRKVQNYPCPPNLQWNPYARAHWALLPGIHQSPPFIRILFCSVAV